MPCKEEVFVRLMILWGFLVMVTGGCVTAEADRIRIRLFAGEKGNETKKTVMMYACLGKMGEARTWLATEGASVADIEKAIITAEYDLKMDPSRCEGN